MKKRNKRTKNKRTKNKQTKNMNVKGKNIQILFGHSKGQQFNNPHTEKAGVAKAICEIWESIVDVEHFLTIKISEQINTAVKQDCHCKHIDIDPQILKNTLDLIQKKSIQLPSAVTQAAENIIYYTCEVYNGYIATINRGCRREITLEEVNRYVADRLNSDTYRQLKQILYDSYQQVG